MAHRFLVPEGSTSGVPDANYTYAGYSEVPFEVWDVTRNKQLMVSFRDQDRNGEFNLRLQNTDGTALLQSREYIFIEDVDYNASGPSASVAVNGGMKYRLMFFFWPVLTPGSSWPNDVIPSTLLLRRGDTLAIQNQDTAVHRIGLVSVAPGTTARIPVDARMETVASGGNRISVAGGGQPGTALKLEIRTLGNGTRLRSGAAARAPSGSAP